MLLSFCRLPNFARLSICFCFVLDLSVLLALVSFKEACKTDQWLLYTVFVGFSIRRKGSLSLLIIRDVSRIGARC